MDAVGKTTGGTTLRTRPAFRTASARWPATTAASWSGSTSGTITCAAAQNHAWEAAAEKAFNRSNILLLKILLDMLDVKFLLK